MSSNRASIRNEVMSKLKLHGCTLTHVVEEMNSRHPERKNTTIQNISNKLTRGTIKYSEILEIAEIAGFDILWESSDP